MCLAAGNGRARFHTEIRNDMGVSRCYLLGECNILVTRKVGNCPLLALLPTCARLTGMPAFKA